MPLINLPFFSTSSLNFPFTSSSNFIFKHPFCNLLMKQGAKEEDPLSTLVTRVVAYYRGLERGPYKVQAALQRVEQADENSTERILVERSDLAWRAYHAVNNAINIDRGFSGKAELKRLVNHLSVQSIDRRRQFADQLASEMENMEVNASTQGAKRRRIAAENGTAAPVQPTAIVCTTDARSIDAEHDATEETPGFMASRDVYDGAPLELAEGLFHDQFWDSIERKRVKGKDKSDMLLADISMLFQQGYIRDHFGCQMEIGIAQEKVAGLAFQYFGVKLEVKDGVRSVCYPSGGKIEPDPSIKLRACQRDLSGLFRGDLYEGAQTSPIYQREKRERRNRTDGVSMTISNQAKEGAKITVFLGEWRASAIKTKFYG
ncbi:hypothetical protein F66182_10790 [Fusarium sp. NRRL 66182]|nr:hypothetical protein F66182_10790 [Fusarium sp. NRRL 66182]